MLSPAICLQRVVHASIRPSVCDLVSQHDIVQTACENFTKFTTLVQLETQINYLLHYEVKKSNVKIAWKFFGGGILTTI